MTPVEHPGTGCIICGAETDDRVCADCTPDLRLRWVLWWIDVRFRVTMLRLKLRALPGRIRFIVRGLLCRFGLMRHDWEIIHGVRHGGGSDANCTKCSKWLLGKSIIEVAPNDKGPVDEEHVEVIVRLQNGTALAQVKQMLLRCKRPARLKLR